MKKIISSIIILLLIALAFLFLNKNNSVVYNISKQDSTSKILSPKIKYADLNSYEKTLADKVLSKMDVSYLENSYGENYKDYILLRHYNNDTAIFCIPTGKIGCYIQFYDIRNWIKIDTKDIVIAGNEAASNNYLIILNSNELLYFKSGMKDFEVINGSKIVNPTETYIKQSGMLDEYDFTFTENIKTLKVSMFKNENKEDKQNIKLKEVEFVLP